ncbi:MAG: VOC family protein [Cytophagaceae bacterium]|nr:VOC family protein [Cytophagaceae bacterium]
MAKSNKKKSTAKAVKKISKKAKPSKKLITVSASQKITPFLWYDGKAEEAARFYTGIFKNSKVLSVSPTTTSFRLAGINFMALISFFSL